MSTTSSASRYREIEVSGPPRQLGQQLGEAAREEIASFHDVALEAMRERERVSAEDALRVASDSIPFVERYAPELLDEMRGIAEGAGVTVEQIMFLQVRNQLGATTDAGCTSLALPPDPLSGRGPIVAQNWDNDPRLDPSMIVLTRRPTGRAALMTVGPAGLIAYIGFNEHAIAACLNTLPAPSRALGVPHYFTLRELFASDTLDGAVSAVRRAHRVIPANIMLSTPQGPADLEVTIDDVHVLRDVGPDAALTHTNHCRHPDLRSTGEAFPDLAQSRARQARIDTLLPASGVAMADLQASLRDHAGHPRSICRHANDDADTGWWQTVLSVIIEPQDQRMHVTRGTPCEQPYETYALA